MFLRFKKNMKNNGICQGRLRLFHHMYGLYGTCFAKFVCFRSVHQLWIMRTLLSTAVERKICAGKSWSNATNQHPRNSKPPIEVAVGQAQQIPPRIPIAVRAWIVVRMLSLCFFFVLPHSLWLHACSKRQCVFFMFAAFAVFNKFPRKKGGTMWRCPKWHKTKCFTIFATCGIFSKYPKHNAGALWGIPKLRKQVLLHVCCFCCFQQILEEIRRGAMWRYPKIWKNKVFLHFCCLLFSANLQKQAWRYVALCGAMWRYPKIWKNKVFLHFCCFCCFQQISKKQAWCYVALCGAIPKFEKTQFFSIFAVFAVFSKSPKTGVALCGAMWRYPKIWRNKVFLHFCRFCCFQQISKKQAWRYVALCGAMWRYVALSQNLKKHSFFQFLPFLLFSANLQKQAWRYVALCGAIPKFEKTKFFSIFAVFAVFSKSPKTGVALCGAMWRYVALSQNLKKQSFSSFLLFSANFGKKEAWRYVAVSQNPKKQVFQQNVVGLCGVAPRLQFSANVKNSRGAMWCIQKNI